MKLRALYCNDPVRFPRINFHDGLNVVFAKVRDPKLQNRDSHNLGKTFLIRVIDFACLSGAGKDHPFKVHGDAFGDFVFYIELETNDGKFVTVRRAVSGRKTISINVSKGMGQSCLDMPTSDWLHSDLGLDKARGILNTLLSLSAIKPFDFRKGLGYFLRRQKDYDNEFFISKFARGKDRDWKPFMAMLLGFDHELVLKKYDLDDREGELQTTLRELESGAGRRSEEFDELKGVLDVKEREVSVLRNKVNKFDFADVESQITTDTVRDIESRIADLNESSYGLKQEQTEIERALKTSFGFDVEELQKVFQEAEIAMPAALLRGYDELVQFNMQISSARKVRLGTRLKQVASEIGRLSTAAQSLNNQRVAALEVVMNRETLVKFRAIQQGLLLQEEELGHLRLQLRQADRATEIRQDIRRISEERNRLVDQMEAMVKEGSEKYSLIREHFAEFARAILFAPAVMSITTNKSGNMEFRTRIIDKSLASRETEEGEGTSWKKVLCASFDLAMLDAWSTEPFYRFAYHDGVFEGLDNRRKVSLLNTIRRVCGEAGIQYILTVIDTDLPRNEEDEKVLFEPSEIVRELDDGGEQGRLFRMPVF